MWGSSLSLQCVLRFQGLLCNFYLKFYQIWSSFEWTIKPYETLENESWDKRRAKIHISMRIRSLIRIVTGRIWDGQECKVSPCGQRMLCLDCVGWFCWAHMSEVRFLTLRLMAVWFAGLESIVDWLKPPSPPPTHTHTIYIYWQNPISILGVLGFVI